MPRNASGVYALPAGNPVVPTTVIATTWANPTLTDVANELTNSLDRSGRGAMLAPFKSVDGTVGAPGITFNSETTSGFYRGAAGQISISILGAEVLRATSVGLGVGAAADSIGLGATWRTLEVAAASTGAAVAVSHTGTGAGQILGAVIFGTPGSSSADKVGASIRAVRVNATVASAASKLEFYTNAGTANTLRATIDESGNVGIGTVPAVKLHVRASAPAASPAWSGVDSIVSSQTTNNVMQLHAGAAGGTLGYAFAVAGTRSVGSVAYDTTANAMVFNTNSAERVRIDSSGNVGIGTTPSALLHLLSTTPIVRLQQTSISTFTGLEVYASGNVTGSWKFNSNSGEMRHDAGFATYGGFQTFYTNGVERTRIDVSGNVGIGITPTFRLDVLSSTASTVRFATSGTGANGGGVRLSTDSTTDRIYIGSGAFLSGSFGATDSGVFGAASCNLWLGANNTEWVKLFTDGRLAGRALHNNAGAVTGTTDQFIASGTYTPTMTAVSNIAAITNRGGFWIRVGNVVTVWVSANVDPTAGSASTSMRISLPIPSNLVNDWDLVGTLGFSGNESMLGGGVYGHTIADEAVAVWYAAANLTPLVQFAFSYVVQ